MAADVDLNLQKPDVTNSVLAKGFSGMFSQLLDSSLFSNTDWGRALGNVFSTGISTATNTMAQNLFKGQALTQGLGTDTLSSISGAGAGLVGYGIGQGISELGGNSRLSRGLGAGISTAIGTLGGNGLSNIIKGKNFFQGFRPLADMQAAKDTFKTAYQAGSSAADSIKTATAATDAAKKAKSIAINNIAGLGMQVVGSGLQAALGPSKEYGGKYGGITQGMDTAYDLIQTGVGFVPGVGSVISGAMSLNKGLSNIFGSTDGMTRTDAILGSAFMPAPVKWLNMLGAHTTGTFNNQSWQNTERTNAFMGNAFGNLGEKFDKAREEAGKTYGTFSHGAYNRAQDNINFANNAWDKILAMTDQNELQKIRSQYMTSINNQRYAQDIQGGWSPLARGKYGMKILNNATNHNIGMRLLSGAALIDDKQMILCNVPD